MLTERLRLCDVERDNDWPGALMLILADIDRLRLALPDCVTDRLIERLPERLIDALPVVPHTTMR